MVTFVFGILSSNDIVAKTELYRLHLKQIVYQYNKRELECKYTCSYTVTTASV
jgi:hypothetical protein